MINDSITLSPELFAISKPLRWNLNFPKIQMWEIFYPGSMNFANTIKQIENLTEFFRSRCFNLNYFF